MTAEADMPSSPRPATGKQDLEPRTAFDHGVGADGERRGGEATTSPSPSTLEERPEGMIPARTRRRTKIERGSMRILATGGIIGIATLLGAVLGSQDVVGWIVGLAVGLTSVILAAVLWSSRQLSGGSRRPDCCDRRLRRHRRPSGADESGVRRTRPDRSPGVLLLGRCLR